MCEVWKRSDFSKWDKFNYFGWSCRHCDQRLFLTLNHQLSLSSSHLLSLSDSFSLSLPLPETTCWEVWANTSGGSRPSHSSMSSGCHSEWSWHGRYANPLSFKFSQEASAWSCLSLQPAEHTRMHTHTDTHAHMHTHTQETHTILRQKNLKDCSTEQSTIRVLDQGSVDTYLTDILRSCMILSSLSFKFSICKISVVGFVSEFYRQQ